MEFEKTSFKVNIRLLSGKHQKQNILRRMHIFSLLYQNVLFFALTWVNSKSLRHKVFNIYRKPGLHQ